MNFDDFIIALENDTLNEKDKFNKDFQQFLLGLYSKVHRSYIQGCSIDKKYHSIDLGNTQNSAALSILCSKKDVMLFINDGKVAGVEAMYFFDDCRFVEIYPILFHNLFGGLYSIISIYRGGKLREQRLCFDNIQLTDFGSCNEYKYLFDFLSFRKNKEKSCIEKRGFNWIEK